MKRLPIPPCHRILTEGGPHFCGAPSVAVLLDVDGQERFVCGAHDPKELASAGAWGLHRRIVAASPSRHEDPLSAGRVREEKPRTLSAEAKANQAAGRERARAAREVARAVAASTASQERQSA